MPVRAMKAAGHDALKLATELLQRARRADPQAGVWEGADINGRGGSRGVRQHGWTLLIGRLCQKVSEGFLLVDRTNRPDTPHPMRHRNDQVTKPRLAASFRHLIVVGCAQGRVIR